MRGSNTPAVEKNQGHSEDMRAVIVQELVCGVFGWPPAIQPLIATVQLEDTDVGQSML